jgi:hypothetical protein
MLTTLKTVSIVCVGLLLTACASGPKYADIKSSIPPLASDKGRVYFYRNTSVGGLALQPSIMLNGEKVGNSQPGGFFYVDRVPGSYEASCKTETEKKINFALQAGQERYVKTNVSMGFLVGHVTPELIDADEGSVAIQSLKFTPDKSAQK